MIEIYCPTCSAKSGKADISGLYKHNKGDLWQISCLKCGWTTEPFAHHEDIQLPKKQELKDNWH